MARVALSVLFAGIFYFGWMAVAIPTIKSGFGGWMAQILLWILAPVVTGLGFAVGPKVFELLPTTEKSRFWRTYKWCLAGCGIGGGVVCLFGPMLIVFGMFAAGTLSVVLCEVNRVSQGGARPADWAVTMSDPREGQVTVRSERPWGDIHMVVRNQRCSVDLTHVRPGHRASLHSHAERYELFHFLDPGAYLEIDGQTYRPEVHDEFLIRPGQRHRFWSDERSFRMLVVTFGPWKPDDQVRHEDDYGREGQTLEI